MGEGGVIAFYLRFIPVHKFVLPTPSSPVKRTYGPSMCYSILSTTTPTTAYLLRLSSVDNSKEDMSQMLSPPPNCFIVHFKLFEKTSTPTWCPQFCNHHPPWVDNYLFNYEKNIWKKLTCFGQCYKYVKKIREVLIL